MASDYQTKAGSYVNAGATSLLKNVYTWMCMALAITGLVSLFTASSAVMINFLFSSKFVFFGCLLVEFGVVVYLVSRVENMSFSAAMFWFVLYSVLNGLTLSVIFLVYTATSIAGTFFISAGMFGAMSIFGYVTKKDLSSWGSMLTMLLIGLVIALVVNMFLNSSTFNLIISIVGVVVFTLLTAYDTQKIKNILSGAEADEHSKKLALIGSLSLYLDFINLFLYLLRFLGNRR
ncbi:MAG: Bax inhibitor-1/YccA family protein [Rikenellaceae bacterium]|nr:Bax inhibitor-1/YccA family protein [Rikenellaceae bacterium]